LNVTSNWRCTPAGLAQIYGLSVLLHDFSSLEGYLGAKIAGEAVRRAGSRPDREHVLAALKTLGEYNLGGLWVNYTPQARKGWSGVDLTIINVDGRLQK
jgi:branched-chain amino acid transport system substrate-binding protein